PLVHFHIKIISICVIDNDLSNLCPLSLAHLSLPSFLSFSFSCHVSLLCCYYIRATPHPPPQKKKKHKIHTSSTLVMRNERLQCDRIWMPRVRKSLPSWWRWGCRRLIYRSAVR